MKKTAVQFSSLSLRRHYPVQVKGSFSAWVSNPSTPGESRAVYRAVNILSNYFIIAPHADKIWQHDICLLIDRNIQAICNKCEANPQLSNKEFSGVSY